MQCSDGPDGFTQILNLTTVGIRSQQCCYLTTILEYNMLILDTKALFILFFLKTSSICKFLLFSFLWRQYFLDNVTTMEKNRSYRFWRQPRSQAVGERNLGTEHMCNSQNKKISDAKYLKPFLSASWQGLFLKTYLFRTLKIIIVW